MLLIKVLSLIVALPALYTICKFFKKKELNFFDFLLLFHSFYFCVIPIISSTLAFREWQNECNQDVVVQVFIYYLIFSVSLLIYNIFWTHRYDTKNCLFNITLFLKSHPITRINTWMQVGIFVVAVYSLLVYTPQISSISAFLEIQEINITYEESSFIKFGGIVFKFCYALCLFIFFHNIKLKRQNILFIVSIFLFLLSTMLYSRRVFLSYLLLGGIVFYSINRAMITRKLLILVGFIGLLVYVVWFPFFNVFRTGDINSTSFVDIFKYGVKHYSRDRNDAMNATEGRSLGLYFAVYNLIENDRYASMGKSTIAAIDHAIPKILNPSKGLGTEEELERRMKTYIDSADSVLLLAYAEFSFFGGVYAVLLFSLIYLFYNKVSNGIFKNNLINLFSIFILFDMSFNVERKLDAIFSEMISFLLFGIIVLIVYKMGLMLFIRR